MVRNSATRHIRIGLETPFRRRGSKYRDEIFRARLYCVCNLFRSNPSSLVNQNTEILQHIICKYQNSYVLVTGLCLAVAPTFLALQEGELTPHSLGSHCPYLIRYVIETRKNARV